MKAMRREIEGSDVAAAPVVSEGGRIPSTLSTSVFPNGELVLLCHKLARWQQGHRGKRRAMLRASLMRMVAIDALMWRSARMGGSAWSITRGYERRLDDQGFVV